MNSIVQNLNLPCLYYKRGLSNLPITLPGVKLLPRRALHPDELTLWVDWLREELVRSDVVARDQSPQGVGKVPLLLTQGPRQTHVTTSHNSASIRVEISEKDIQFCVILDTSCKTPKWPQTKWYTRKNTIFWQVFNTLSYDVIRFVASVSLKNHWIEASDWL